MCHNMMTDDENGRYDNGLQTLLKGKLSLLCSLEAAPARQLDVQADKYTEYVYR